MNNDILVKKLNYLAQIVNSYNSLIDKELKNFYLFEKNI